MNHIPDPTERTIRASGRRWNLLEYRHFWRFSACEFDFNPSITRAPTAPYLKPGEWSAMTFVWGARHHQTRVTGLLI